MTYTSDLSAFARLVIALEPWLDDVVIIGGWAHRLYRLHPSAQHLDYAPIMTLDTDLAVPAVLPAKEQDIRERLLQNGFTEEFLGNDNPPATHYRLGKNPPDSMRNFLHHSLAKNTTAKTDVKRQHRFQALRHRE